MISVAWSLSGCRRPTLPTIKLSTDNPSASRVWVPGSWLALVDVVRADLILLGYFIALPLLLAPLLAYQKTLR